jgi:hypothetical protein
MKTQLIMITPAIKSTIIDFGMESSCEDSIPKYSVLIVNQRMQNLLQLILGWNLQLDILNQKYSWLILGWNLLLNQNFQSLHQKGVIQWNSNFLVCRYQNPMN